MWSPLARSKCNTTKIPASAEVYISESRVQYQSQKKSIIAVNYFYECQTISYFHIDFFLHRHLNAERYLNTSSEAPTFNVKMAERNIIIIKEKFIKLSPS